MTWEKIIGEIDKIKQIVDNWQKTGEIHGIEKEIALDKLRLVYEEVKFAKSQSTQAEQEAVEKPTAMRIETAPIAVAKEQNEEVVNISDVPIKARHDRKKLMSLYGDGSESVGTPHGNMGIVEPQDDIVIGMHESIVDSNIPEVDMFASKSGGQAERSESGVDILEAMGLAEEPVNVASREEVRVKEPVAEDILSHTEKNNGQTPYNKVLGETIKTGETFADVYARNNKREDVAEHINSVNMSSIRGAIGINDRFLLIRDLFGGNADACDKTIKELDAFTDLDDALLYIHDNFSWNPESDGAKLMIDLLTRKLS